MTSRWLERVKLPESGRVEYLDSKVSGLGIRISFTGKLVWYVVYRVKGNPKLRRLTLEPFPTLSLADAREKAQGVVLAASRGLDPAAQKQVERGAPTFAELAAEYLERHAKQKKRSWQEDERNINRDLVPAWGGVKAPDVTRKDVIRLLDAINDRGAPIQSNRVRSLISKIFNWGLERDIVTSNPCSQVKAVASENQRDRVLTEGEIPTVWEAFEQQDTLICCMFKLRLLTAQRGGEISSMRWSDIDMTSGWWTIPSGHSKNKMSHRVPLSTFALDIVNTLHGQTGQSEWVFPSPTRAGQHIVNIQKAAERMREVSGIDFVPHDLRRTAASHMTGLGIPRLVVSKILNHTEQGATRVYDRHSYDAEKRLALERWSVRLIELMKAGNA